MLDNFRKSDNYLVITIWTYFKLKIRIYSLLHLSEYKCSTYPAIIGLQFSIFIVMVLTYSETFNIYSFL